MKNNKFLKIVFISLSALLISSAIFKVLTPQEKLVPQTSFTKINKNQTKTQFSQIQFVGENFIPPEKLSIIRIEQIADEEEVINQIISNFELTKNSQSPRYWTNSQKEYLHQDIYSKKYQLITNPQDTSASINKNLEEIIALSTTRLQKIFPQLTLSPIAKEASFLTEGAEFYQQVSFEKADFIKIPFSYQINSFPLLFEKEGVEPFLVNINKQGQILSVEFYPFFIKTKILSEKKSISLEEAIENINQGQGSIISFGFEDGLKRDISVVQSAYLNQVKIEYRLDPEINLTYPFYRFSGEATDATGQKIQVELITPAIVTTPTE